MQKTVGIARLGAAAASREEAADGEWLNLGVPPGTIAVGAIENTREAEG
jgi:hypothetical protein